MTGCSPSYIAADPVTILSFHAVEQGSMQRQQLRHPGDQHVICYLQLPAAM